MEDKTTQAAGSAGSTEKFYKILGWLHANRKQVVTGAIVVAALGLLAGYLSWSKDQKEADANARLFALPVGAASPNAPPMASASAFLELAKDFPSTSAGEYAALLGAEALFAQSNYTEAHREFSKFMDEHPASALVPQARVGVAACLEAQGKVPDAIQKYQEVVSAYQGDFNIVSPIRLTLARLFEEQNKPDQALKLYSELANIKNPYDPWAAEARERGTLLLAKHPELRQTQPAPAPSSAPFSISPSPSATPGEVPAATPAAAAANPQVNLLTVPGVSTNGAAKP